METLQAPRASQESYLRSFDVLASVNMLRYDLQYFGEVLPETQERVCDEELSYVTEGIDRASRTSFVLRREGDELVYFKQGEWQPYTGTLITGLEVARREAEEDPRKQFLADRAADDLVYGYRMRQLQPGQQLVWRSAYPAEEAARYGTEFIQSLGFKPDRQMGFIYRAYFADDGNLVLESQTVDRSDPEAFAAVEAALVHDPEADLDILTRIYDGTLVKKHGGRFYAGRREAEMNENVWNQVRQHQDLIGFYLQRLEEIAGLELRSDELELVVKRERYGFWAALSKRLERSPMIPEQRSYQFHGDPGQYARLAFEQSQAFGEFVSKGRMLVGCGGVTFLQGEQAIMDASPEDVFKSVFGDREEGYKFDKKMHCVVCQAPPEEKAPKKWCGPCGICKLCDTKIQAKNK